MKIETRTRILDLDTKECSQAELAMTAGGVSLHGIRPKDFCMYVGDKDIIVFDPP
jgi:hypothetical protein